MQYATHTRARERRLSHMRKSFMPKTEIQCAPPHCCVDDAVAPREGHAGLVKPQTQPVFFFKKNGCVCNCKNGGVLKNGGVTVKTVV